ncbi:hypothetical protein [Paenibacillus sp. IITD108]|uniref:hypothetical protein n=1 Tax=Paenibacillus sp. IITD108 TaxID=3116649 RepID=UPI002F42741D
MLDKEKLLECLQDEVNCYEGATDERSKVIVEMNQSLIDEINSGRFDTGEGKA